MQKNDCIECREDSTEEKLNAPPWGKMLDYIYCPRKHQTCEESAYQSTRSEKLKKKIK